ncbi:MAG: dUTP diphosphatase [Candidatus Paracaedimonas acanthamoebae]|uniref:Deoxyuridine 5'-triphosphate nucleotidohydrolase n=1 Tax=Candidatus Paracaedimonas acanthamoebae TaxID=244581 RepID=A0A8J7PKZ1_9PROT|nr:dUTP diphosphatase [Candidatus Paracaedimonas acanthamoebae]
MNAPLSLVTIPLQHLPHGADLPLPAHATEDAAGLDLCAAIEEEITLNPLERVLIPCGFMMALPQGFEAQLRPRSGLAFKNGVTLLNSPGTIDADYRGEIKVLLINLGHGPFHITRGMRIAQMVIARYTKASWEVCENFEDSTARGIQGFGSTGTHHKE